MKYRLLIKQLALLILMLFIYRCTEEETTQPPDENLLINTSFENNGKFSSDGWSLPVQSDSSTDVPSGGGSYSLLLEASQPPEIYAQLRVPVKTQFNNYKLTFWSKSSGVTSGIFGKAILSLIRSGSVIKEKSVLVDDIAWSSYSIADTFNVSSGDSFMVQLSAGISQLFSGKTYFDLCKLQAVD